MVSLEGYTCPICGQRLVLRWNGRGECAYVCLDEYEAWHNKTDIHKHKRKRALRWLDKIKMR